MPEKLTKEKNLELYDAWKQTGDMTIVTENIPFIFAAADEVFFSKSVGQRARTPKQDVRHEGVIGFIMGLYHFDKTKGYAVTTYTKWWVYAKAMEFMVKQHVIKLGTTNQKKKAIVALGRDAHKFIDDQGNENLEQLAKANGIDVVILAEIKEALQTQFVSADVVDYESDPSVINGVIFADSLSKNNPEYLLDQKQKFQILNNSRQELIDDIIQKVSPEQRQVFLDLVTRHILPEDSQFLTLDEVAHQNGYRAKQNVFSWKEKLVASLEKKFLNRYRGSYKDRKAVATLASPTS